MPLFVAMKPRKALATVGMGALALTLSGCMKLDVALELSNDDTVDGTMIVGFDKSMADFMGEQYDTMIDDMLNETSGDFPDDATSEPYDDGEYQGAKYTFDAVPLEEFNDSDFAITHEGGEWEFVGSLDTTEDAVGGSPDDLGELGGMGDMSGMVDFDMRIAVTFPGEVLETNGTVDGTTVTWSPEFGDSTEMRATASETGGGDGPPVWLWILIGAVALAALVGGLFLYSRGQKSPAASASADTPADSAQTPPPPPPTPETTEPSAEPGGEEPPDQTPR